jgi:hypothetical protein
MPITAKGPALVDGEFGTLQTLPTREDGRIRHRTEHDKPRFHDIAYYYHLLWITEGSMAARGYINDIKWALRDQGMFDDETSDRELKLSVVERTLSMAGHFVLKPQGKPRPGEDLRRRRAPRYATLLIDTLCNLE